MPVNATNTSTNQTQRSSLPVLGRGLEPGQVFSLDDLEIDLDSPPLVARHPMKVMRVIIRYRLGLALGLGLECIVCVTVIAYVE